MQDLSTIAWRYVLDFTYTLYAQKVSSDIRPPEKSIIKRSRVLDRYIAATRRLFNEFIKITCYCVRRAFSPKCFLFLQQDMGFFVPRSVGWYLSKSRKAFHRPLYYLLSRCSELLWIATSRWRDRGAGGFFRESSLVIWHHLKTNVVEISSDNVDSWRLTFLNTRYLHCSFHIVASSRISLHRSVR